ncbi:MAG TPA: hypothetical protein VIV56_01750 [Gemmatimonadales bacterium]
MSRLLKAVLGSAFALFVAVALTIGAQVAFARSVAADCPNDGSTHLGSCIDNPDCKQKCIQAHPEIPPEEIQGRCVNGCCTCLF